MHGCTQLPAVVGILRSQSGRRWIRPVARLASSRLPSLYPTPSSVDATSATGPGGLSRRARCHPSRPWAGRVGTRLRQLAARGTKERARLGRSLFGRENLILKTMTFHDVTTILNERKHLKMVIRSIPDSVTLILGRTE